jgi:putative ATP-dependent endonuclease of the OLD family
MKISYLKVQNFKTFDSDGISLSFTDLTGLVGENSAGKSNVLEALDLFFNFSKAKLSKRSFHYNDVSKSIVIEVTFTKLSAEEKKTFNVHLDRGSESLTITQRIELKLEADQNANNVDESDYDFVENKYGTKWIATEDYQWARLESKNPNKTNIKKWWKGELQIGTVNFKSFFDPPENEPTPEVYQENLEKLWNDYFDEIPKERTIGDERVLGWKNKLKGNLPKFFYIPAIKYVEEDFKVLKTNPFGEMIGWLTQNISDEIKKDFEERTKELVHEALSKIDQDDTGESKIAFINERLNSNLGINLDCKLELKFGSPSISDIVFPSPQLYANDGYDSEIGMKGHGLQRMSMFSLLRTYNDFQKKLGKYDKNIIVAIEEPEIYLHPPVERATYKLLRSLSENKDQIIYSTHDSHFVAVEHFDEIRLFKKVRSEKTKTLIYEFSVDKLIQHYKTCYKIDIDAKSLRHRFGHICDETKNEGFFAQKVILIEGETEKYSLPIYFAHKGFDIDNERIAMISAGSVDNISYLYVMFNEFHIPCYIIFDGDKPSTELAQLEGDKRDDAKNKSKRNKELLAFAGEQVDQKLELLFPLTTVKNRYAVWETDFETTFQKSLDNYSAIKARAKALYGNDSKPLTGRLFADVLTTEYPDKINPYIDELITKIQACQWTESCLKSGD